MIPKFEILKEQPIEYYFERIKRLHRLAFTDTHRFDSGILRAGQFRKEKEEALLILLKDLLFDLNLYHSLGAIKVTIAKFFNQFLKLEVFIYGNDLILNKFLCEISKSYGIDIDFRRIKSSNITEDALTPTVIAHDYQGEEWPKIPSNIKMKNGKKHLNIDDIDLPIDEDLLTGLNIDTEFNQFYEEIHAKKIGILDADPNDPSFSEKAALALKRVQSFKKLIHECVDLFFVKKTPVVGTEKPKFFMTQGGVGSGKTKLESYASAITGGNYIIASLDSARELIPEYQLYLQAGHHSDDYRALRTLAYIIMGEVVNKAISENYNYFRDGSGIPYDARNSELVKIMKDSGYETYVLSAAAPLYIHKDRKDLHEPVHERIIERYKKKSRMVPWDIVLNKHINHPLAMMQAAQDENSDHVVIFDNMSARGLSYKIAESYWVDDLFYNKLITSTNDKRMYELIQSLGFFQDINTTIDMQLTYLIAARKRKYDHRLFIYQDVYKILAIYNQERFIDIIQKAALNINAKGYEDLPFNTLPFICVEKALPSS